ncbi:Qat anti-phage system associated protein QatB [Ensifer aridi]|uniref:Qat anti-phage system associated protein QatB n=1 Tax=Ensifer aridi TaxID=1708715 RepID=UPI0030B8091B
MPSWLETPSGTPGTAPAAPPGQQPTSPQPGTPQPGTPQQPSTPPASPAPPPPSEQRYTPGRKAFNKGARSGDAGDRERSFGRAASSYVSRSGGGGGASARASSDRRAAGRLADFLVRAGADGSDIRQELRRLNLASLAQRSTAEIFDALIDYVCEPGGDLDEAFVRDAYSEALHEVPPDMIDQLERPDSAMINFVLERFIANTIMSRLLNAVGNGAITLPETASSAVSLNDSFRDWVLGRVQDAMEATHGVFREGQVSAQIDRIFEAAYGILERAGQEEADDQ